MRLTRLACVVLATLVLFASACSKNETPQEPDKKPVKEETPVKATAPLTGVETKIAPPERAVAVTINNHPDARPQSGLSQADVVYEVLAEGKVTRFLAIFQSEKPESIGPVRSARQYFIDLSQGYDALFIAHGYSPEAKESLKSGAIDNINGIQHDGTLFKRVDFRQAPHNSYITFKNIEKGAEDAGYEMDEAPKPLSFLTDEEAGNLSGDAAANVKVAYSQDENFIADYHYDSENEKYTRSSGGAETVEYDNDNPVLLDNVIVIEAAHTIKDSEGRLGIDLNSGGKAYVFQKGIAQEAEWKNEDGRVFPYINGEPIKLIPGKTWINIVPELTMVSFGE
ncbi:lipoprotein [Bacillus freudenreichii]|nr:lipoprotein [Bacillus freudenreichii]